METREFKIDGITCMGCVSAIEKALYGSSAIKQVSIDKETGKTEISGEALPHQDIVNSLVAGAGNYTVVDATFKTTSASTKGNRSYKPLLLVVGYLLGTTLLVEFSSGMFIMDTWMPNFMAGFFLVFSFFKLLDIKGFANAYAMYDVIAAKWKGYGYVYPFIELALGIAYIMYSDNPITHLVTAIVMFVSLIGVVRSVLNKTEIKCACLGTGFNLPMSYVTIIEDGLMLIMALIMYYFTK
jgi:copper chaperone CopZ